MSGILALFNRRGEPVERPAIEAMLAANRGRAVDGQAVWLDGPIALGHQHFRITPEELYEEQPLADGRRRYYVTANVRLDNRAELARRLANDAADERGLSDAQIILLAYQAWSTDCARHLLGEFAFAIWDREEQSLFVARDAMGVRQVYYYIDEKVCLVASEIESILAHPAVEARINEGKVGEYLAAIWDNQEETYFDGIRYCPPAHCLTVTRDATRQWPYWQLDPDARVRYRDPREYADHLLALMEAAIDCRTRTNWPVGISLSGGLDSTSVAAVAARSRGNSNLLSFSYVFDELIACDEREYIVPVVDALGLDARYVAGDDKWPLRWLDEWPVPRDPISLDPYVWLPVSLMRAAQGAGCRVMLSGHFGDMLFEGASFWAADMMREWRLLQLVRTTRSLGSARRRQDIVENGLRQFIPYGWKETFRHVRPRPVAEQYEALEPDFVVRARLIERGRETRDRDRYPLPGQWSRYMGLTLGVTPPTMATLAAMWNRHGIELTEPLRDRRLVEYVFAIPADMLGLPGNHKRVLREAMRDRLPEKVRLRAGKTTYEPLFDLGLRDKERATVETILKEPEIVKRGFVKKEWLDKTLPHGCSVVGEGFTLWRCVTVELWLQRHWRTGG